MKVIKAIWEKRNIGYDTYEIMLNKKDFSDKEKILEELSNPMYKGCYLVLKMPVGNLDVLHALEDFGFRFMETQFAINKDITNYQSPASLEKYDQELVRYEVEKDEQKWKKILDLMTYDMYSTDRIYLDPLLPEGCSLIRYKNWMMDLMAHPDAHLFVTEYEKEILAFGVDILDFEKKKVIGMIGGVMEEFQKEGLGFLAWNLGIHEYSSMGLEKYITSISSNNLSVVRLYQYFDFKINSMQYVLRKMVAK